MADMKVVVPKEALDALTQILDIAVKHAGLQVAEVAVFWNRKIQEAEVVEPPKPEESKVLDVTLDQKSEHKEK